MKKIKTKNKAVATRIMAGIFAFILIGSMVAGTVLSLL
jgi:hypothetical protein